MIIKRPVLLSTVLLIVCLLPVSVQSATYYISPAGSDANPGTSAKPWLTFAYAIDPARASCGDMLLLTNGVYGDGTSTGKISISGLICTAGNELTIRALNQRQAKINDDGRGRAIYIANSAFIIIDGLYARSTDNTSATSSGYGTPLLITSSNNIQVKNLVGRNPNRYVNSHIFSVHFSQRILLEDLEGYVFHRHCIETHHDLQVVARRIYCNPRGGKIPGGFGLDQGPLGSGASVMSMYPCRECILENSIADGTTNGMFLNEMNATYGSGILMSGSKVLGSICYKCSYGNGIFPNARSIADLNHSPQNILIRDVAFIDFNSPNAGIRVSDGVDITLDHITILGGGSGVTGIQADDTARGSTPSTNSLYMTNILVAGLTGSGFRVTGYNTWRGEKLFSNGNRTAFDPSSSSNLTDTSTRPHGMGTCKVWVPADAAVKGAGTGRSDIGANILYRYVNGVLTNIPLWDYKTGSFPHGATDLDQTNNVAGESLFDIHTRLNVNTGGCPFPKNYNGDSDTTLPAAPIGLTAS